MCNPCTRYQFGALVAACTFVIKIVQFSVSLLFLAILSYLSFSFFSFLLPVCCFFFVFLLLCFFCFLDLNFIFCHFSLLFCHLLQMLLFSNTFTNKVTLSLIPLSFPLFFPSIFTLICKVDFHQIMTSYYRSRLKHENLLRIIVKRMIFLLW